jgi:hypothetical protein
MIGGLEANDLGRAGKKKKWVAGLDGGMVRVWFGFFSFSFLFISFQPFYSKSYQVFQKGPFNHTINQKPVHST